MLKALELTGFKSFADKTRFEFPAGITVVVGPNGSGKSNIVDAIKWVLGEQSAKSLRGKEMADVIFKGAGGAGGRKPANSATATIVLDNTDRRFAYDADEVLVSRRVYRSGEAEYLINNETSRLKDIRNMFRGTGIGTDAYSLIEQGKVDRMLQASAKDRRAIFEEAAGISRFKAKKIEAQRRLARVDGNLVRLADIVEEVGSRYRSVKNQASKASKYKEYSERLQELRTFVGLKDWRALSEKLTEIETQNQTLKTQSSERRQRIAELEQQADSIEQQLQKFSAESDQRQQHASQTREQLAAHKARLELNQSRIADLDERDKELQSQIQRLSARQKEVDTRQRRAEEDVQESEQLLADSQKLLVKLETELQSVDDQVQNVSREDDVNRETEKGLVGTISDLGRLVSAAETQLESLVQRLSQNQSDMNNCQAELDERNTSLADFQRQKEALEANADAKNSDLASARSQLTQARKTRSGIEKQLAELTHALAGKSQRQKVLQELEKRLEGVNAGAKQLLEQAKKSPTGPYHEIIGVVADLITVNVQHAGIVDVALGNAAQYILVRGTELLDLLTSEKLRVKGRVGIIQLHAPPTLGADPHVSINGEPGVIGRADRLVQVHADYAAFVRTLLGGTWIVRTLADAISLHQRKLGRIRMITLDGEIVEADGAVIVGPKAVVTGLVSRRSELRLLAQEIGEIEQAIERTNAELEQAQQVETEGEELVQELINENSILANQLSDISVRTEEAEKQVQQLSRQLERSQREKAEIDTKQSTVSQELSVSRSTLVDSESQLKTSREQSAAHEIQLNELRSQRLEIEKNLTQAKVNLAKAEQHLNSLHQQNQQIVDEAEQLTQELQRYAQQSQTDKSAHQLADQEIKSVTEKLLVQERELHEVTELLKEVNRKKEEIDTERRTNSVSLNQCRSELKTSDDELHKVELKTNHLQMDRARLVERLQEDYGIDIAALETAPLDETELAEREAIDGEISSLRKKIGAIGSVNMDALAELEDLEQRYQKMDEQYQDLVAAKQSLENIIQRINTDSRRLFVETLEAIRGNFQTLFRQTFGGGKADVILEEGVDPLEAGVEIVATPPGKPEFNNSLLSGGEKALTAVSLLMAIFQFRPSPFCVLDEVDAPFDEANIGRFVDVLKSFLGWTKFVIVTHSKKTMTAATTLYGVTMQESGVSKRVSVRFEDVGEDGAIADAAVDRSTADGERGVA